ncbi:MAG: ferrochelatase, partial [Candidatus Thioglobus sp.]|nr:ferrochelatase [Candidatus Thioglobus sp.]
DFSVIEKIIQKAKIAISEAQDLVDLDKIRVEFLGKKGELTPVAMRYGNPSISKALRRFEEQGCEKIIALPLYPQYSKTTTLSTFEEIKKALESWDTEPELIFIEDYHQNADYIQSLANSVLEHQLQHGKPDKLLISFHGIPQRFVDNGDPYYQHCVDTARLLAAALELKTDDYQLCFQSIFGREKWLNPYTKDSLKSLANAGDTHIQVICPGFSADCLETLEEIDEENRGYFIDAGGKKFSYIPALNDRKDHISAICGIISQHLK